MKYKIGDKVRVKSLDWYDKNKDSFGYVRRSELELLFNESMSAFCGKTAIITKVGEDYYKISVDNGYWRWYDYMLDEYFASYEDDDTVVPIQFGDLYIICDVEKRKAVNTEFYSTLKDAINEIQSRRQSESQVS